MKKDGRDAIQRDLRETGEIALDQDKAVSVKGQPGPIKRLEKLKAVVSDLGPFGHNHYTAIGNCTSPRFV